MKDLPTPAQKMDQCKGTGTKRKASPPIRDQTPKSAKVVASALRRASLSQQGESCEPKSAYGIGDQFNNDPIGKLEPSSKLQDIEKSVGQLLSQSSHSIEVIARYELKLDYIKAKVLSAIKENRAMLQHLIECIDTECPTETLSE